MSKGSFPKIISKEAEASPTHSSDSNVERTLTSKPKQGPYVVQPISAENPEYVTDPSVVKVIVNAPDSFVGEA